MASRPECAESRWPAPYFLKGVRTYNHPKHSGFVRVVPWFQYYEPFPDSRWPGHRPCLSRGRLSSLSGAGFSHLVRSLVSLEVKLAFPGRPPGPWPTSCR